MASELMRCFVSHAFHINPHGSTKLHICHSCIHSFTHSFTHFFAHSWVCLFPHSFIHPIIHSVFSCQHYAGCKPGWRSRTTASASTDSDGLCKPLPPGRPSPQTTHPSLLSAKRNGGRFQTSTTSSLQEGH